MYVDGIGLISKFIFSVCILFGLQSPADDEDPNRVKNTDPKILEASAPQVPCEGCAEKLNLDLTNILRVTDKGLSAMINDDQPRSGVLLLKPKRVVKDLRDLLKFKIGEGTIEIKKKGFIYRKPF